MREDLLPVGTLVMYRGRVRRVLGYWLEWGTIGTDPDKAPYVPFPLELPTFCGEVGYPGGLLASIYDVQLVHPA